MRIYSHFWLLLHEYTLLYMYLYSCISVYSIYNIQTAWCQVIVRLCEARGSSALTNGQYRSTAWHICIYTVRSSRGRRLADAGYACTARHAVRASALEASSVRSDRPKRKGAGTGGAYERYAKDNERGTEPQWGGSS